MEGLYIEYYNSNYCISEDLRWLIKSNRKIMDELRKNGLMKTLKAIKESNRDILVMWWIENVESDKGDSLLI